MKGIIAWFKWLFTGYRMGARLAAAESRLKSVQQIASGMVGSLDDIEKRLGKKHAALKADVNALQDQAANLKRKVDNACERADAAMKEAKRGNGKSI